jgi:hypothetical protein
MWFEESISSHIYQVTSEILKKFDNSMNNQI